MDMSVPAPNPTSMRIVLVHNVGCMIGSEIVRDWERCGGCRFSGSVHRRCWAFICSVSCAKSRESSEAQALLDQSFKYLMRQALSYEAELA
jgi:hypothetical protein